MRNVRWGMPTSKQARFKAATERADKLRAKGNEFDFAELRHTIVTLIRLLAGKRRPDEDREVN